MVLIIALFRRKNALENGRDVSVWCFWISVCLFFVRAVRFSRDTESMRVGYAGNFVS